MRHLHPLKRGPKILRDWLNRLRDCVIAQRIVRGEGYEVDERPGGSQLVFENKASRVRLVINPTDTISATTGTTETSTTVPWPDATACVIDMGAQDDAIAQVGYRVSGGTLYIRWRSMAASGFDVPLNGSDITITAFL